VIDEAELTALLTAAAVSFDVPEDGPARIMAAAAAPVDHPAWWRRHRLAVAAAAILVLLGGTFALGSVHGRHGTPIFQTAREGQSESRQLAGGSASGEAGSVGGPAAPGVRPASPQVPPLGEAAKVVKTGSVDVEVGRGRVGPSMARLTSLAAGMNGYVAKTTTSEGDEAPSGTMTLRVPAAAFESAVRQVRGLGRVRSFTSQGQDVTAQYTDLQARLGALTATRDQLLTILQKATTVGDVLAVQDRMTQVQTQIDQLQGQQKVLDDQTTYAALSVSVSERGSHHSSPVPRTGLAKAWDEARGRFTGGLEAILRGSGTAVVVLLVLAAVALVGRLVWGLFRRRLV